MKNKNHKVLSYFLQGRTSNASNLPLIMSWLGGLIIVILPFHAFLTVWLASAVDHYTLLRLWKEFILIGLSAGVLYLLVNDKRLRQRILASRLAQLIGAYFLLTLIWGSGALLLDKVTLKALGFGLIVNLRYLIFFLILWIIATQSQWLGKLWPKLILIPAAIVLLIGLAQRLILPYDVLKHFGYSSETIFPYQTINRDINYPRIISTLRGANPLGAYLVLIISTIGVFFLKFREKRWLGGIGIAGSLKTSIPLGWLWGAFGLAALLVLFFSHSRGAWIGLTLSLVFLGWISLWSQGAKRLVLAGLTLMLIFGVISTLALRDNLAFQNYFFHTSERSTVAESSNEEHLSAKTEGMRDIVTEPLGRGIGTAGPASVYNDGRGRIADNYFIQIGQEVGWLGLGIFLIINFLVVRELWFRRQDNLATILLVSFVGLTAINMVSHAWTDDTLAYIWWGLAGIALAPALVESSASGRRPVLGGHSTGPAILPRDHKQRQA